MRVKPAIPGAVIRDPVTKQALSSDGAYVPSSTFWQRRIRSGEVILVEEVARDERIPPLTTRGPR